MTYVIRNDIPLPISYRKYPFALMGVGDSIEIAAEDRDRAAAAVHSYSKKHGMKFTLRKTHDGSFRCWRTE